MKDYKQIAKEVLRHVGGEANVSHMEHCSTRLRFTLADPDKADHKALKSIKGVLGIMSSGPQCQVVIGGDVIEVYNELVKLGKIGGAAPVKDAGKGKKDIGPVILDFVVGVFQPLVPAISGAGMLKALLTILVTFNLMSADDTVYKVFYYVADAVLYYLPIMVAYTTASKLNCNKLVAVAIAGAMILPNTTAMLAAEGGATLFGITLQNVAYANQVFPSVLIVAFLAIVEHNFTKVCPKPVRTFLVPMVCFMVTFPVALIVLGPLGYNVGSLVTSVILWLYNTLGWVAVAILAAILPFMVGTGMHKALVPYTVAAMASPGYEILYMSASLAHNMSEGGAALAVAIKSKNEELKSVSFSSGIAALFGITEPALFSVTLLHKKAMAGVCIGGFASGVFLGLMKVKAFVAMGPSIPGMAMYMDPNNGKNLIWACIGLVIAVAVSFIATLLIYNDEKTDALEDTADKSATTETPVTEISECEIVSPMNGKVIPLTEVEDEVFSSGILGNGVAVLPEKGELYAPADGTVLTIAESKHSVAMVTDTGVELLMHVGMDTVKLNGKHYAVKVKNGDKVKKGQLLMKFDMDEIKKSGFDIITPIVVANSDKFSLKSAQYGEVKIGKELMKLEVMA